MFKPFAMTFATFAISSALFTTGCSSSSSTGTGAGSTKQSGDSSGDAADGGSGSGGGAISASDLGAQCSGGTSSGDSVAFTDDTDECPKTGVCLVDDTTSLDVYCSAKCDDAACPSGYTCKTTTIDESKVCFKD